MNFLDEVFQKQIKLNEKIGDSLISLTLKEKRLSTQLTVNAMNAELIELLNWSQFKLWKTKYIPNKEKAKAYLIGMAYGDLSVSEKYKRMTFGTTSAKWYKLVLEFINIAFSNKTKVIRQYTYIRDKSGLAKKYNKGPNKYVSYQLATSEEFIYKELLPYTNDLNKAFKKYDSIEIIRGIFDSEGTISYRVGKTKNPYYQITCCSTDFQMLQKMQAKLITLDIKTTLNKSGLKGINNRTKDIYTIYIRQNSVKIFLNLINFRHPEKSTKDIMYFNPVNIDELQMELIDLLCFWANLCILWNLTPEKIIKTYREKNDINHKRQDNNY